MVARSYSPMFPEKQRWHWEDSLLLSSQRMTVGSCSKGISQNYAKRTTLQGKSPYAHGSFHSYVKNGELGFTRELRFALLLLEARP